MNKDIQIYVDEITMQVEKEKKQIFGTRIGKIIQIGSSNEVFVDFPENQNGPILARIALSSDEIAKIKKQSYKYQVILVFENGNPQLPIVIGFICNKWENLIEFETEKEKNLQDIIIDGKRIVFDANEEILIRCGKGSIILKKNGKIIIRGTDLITRSSGCNRIKGATIKIN